MGTPLDSIFFTHDFFFQFRVRTNLALQINFFFRYDQRPSYMIRFDWKILIFVKSFMGTKLESIFLDTKIDLNYSPGPREVPKSKFDSVR